MSSKYASIIPKTSVFPLAFDFRHTSVIGLNVNALDNVLIGNMTRSYSPALTLSTQFSVEVNHKYTLFFAIKKLPFSSWYIVTLGPMVSKSIDLRGLSSAYAVLFCNVINGISFNTSSNTCFNRNIVLCHTKRI